MDDYIAAIAGVQMTVAGGLLGLLLEGSPVWWLLSISAVLLGSMIVATIAYEDLKSR
jgi:hypothetical protein